MKLKVRTVCAYHVDYYDLERFVENLFGGNCEIVANEEASNDIILSRHVSGEIADYNAMDECKIRQGIYPMYSLATLLNVLCKDGHIEAGKYFIHISW